MSLRKTTSEFIAEAQAKHGLLYDYSKAVYTNAHSKIVIVCLQHGPFEQKAANHLQGRKCPKCPRYGRRLTTAEFINKALAVHGNLYDYSCTEYDNDLVNLVITCPKHGKFQQRPSNHLKGSGCRQCSNEKMMMSLNEFITQAKETHQNKYDYSKSIYLGASKKIAIKCPQHGAFTQIANDHLSGAGCPECAKTSRQTTKTKTGRHAKGYGRQWINAQHGRRAVLYIVRLISEQETFYKAGITFTSVCQRFRGKYPYKIELVAEFTSTSAIDIYEAELTLKRVLKGFRYCPAVKFDGHTECFTSPDPILALLNEASSLMKL